MDQLDKYRLGTRSKKVRRANAVAVAVWLLGVHAFGRPEVQVSEPLEPGLPDETAPARIYAPNNPRVASDGERWLTIYPLNFGDDRLTMGRLVGADGQPQGDPFVVAYHFDPRALVFDGEAYVAFGSCDSAPCFSVVSVNGEPSGDATLIPSSTDRGFTLAAAAAEDGAMVAVVCSAGTCNPHEIIERRDSRRRPTLPLSAVNQLVYSNERFLALSFDQQGEGAVFDVNVLQLDTIGYIVDGTAMALGAVGEGPRGLPAAVAPSVDGFAIALVAWPGIDLLHLDLTGSLVTKSHYPPEGAYATAPSLVRTGAGFLLGCHTVDNHVTIALDESLAPVGEPLLLSGANRGAGGAGGQGQAGAGGQGHAGAEPGTDSAGAADEPDGSGGEPASAGGDTSTVRPRTSAAAAVA